MSMASNVQAILERESEAGESILARAAREEQDEREAEHEQLGAAPNKHEELTAARRMLTAMFPSMDVEVITTGTAATSSSRPPRSSTCGLMASRTP